MKKVCLFLASYLLIISLVACSSSKPETISARIVSHMEDNVLVSLEWRIENKQEHRDLVFSDGNILQYTIEQNSSNKIFSDYKETKTVILKPKEVYSKMIPIDKFKEKGSYDVTFWATTDKGTVVTHKQTFNIE